MQKKIIFGCLALALIAISVTQSIQLRQNGISFRQLINLASADGENGVTYVCETRVWVNTYPEPCPIGTGSSNCQFIELFCYENPYGLFDEDISCSIITCYDCNTGITGITYDDCS